MVTDHRALALAAAALVGAGSVAVAPDFIERAKIAPTGRGAVDADAIRARSGDARCDHGDLHDGLQSAGAGPLPTEICCMRGKPVMAISTENPRCTIIDEYMAGEPPPPDSIGIDYATAGRLAWHREPMETERDFVTVVRREAAAAGYRRIEVRGFLNA